jgi:ABC-type bacteriocin/lantibiotic exporter with double-glycine peptidase domain
VAKKIVLARSIVHKPKLLILKEPLEHFDAHETKDIMEFLTNDERPWSLVVVSQTPGWIKSCSTVYMLDKGQLKK